MTANTSQPATRGSRRGLWRPVCSALLVVAFVTATAPVFGQAEQGALVVQDVTSDDYPDMKIRLTVPVELLSQGAAPDFALTENGKDVELLATDRLATESEQVDVVLAIDTSGSMAGASLDSAKQAAREFVAALQPGNRVALVSFSDRVKVVAPFTSDAGVLDRAIGGLSAAGETAVYDALITSAGLGSTQDASLEAVVLLSDGGDTVSRATLTDTVGAVTGAEVPVFAVALPSDEADPEAMRTIAEQSGGRLVAPGDVAELPALYRGLAEEIQDRFVVVYRSARPSTKDLEIGITAIGRDAQAVGSVVVQNPRYEGKLADEAVVVVPAPADLLSLTASIVLVFVSVGLLVGAIALMVVRPRTTLSHVRYYEQLQGVSGDLPTANDSDPDSLRRKMVGAVGYVASRRGMTGMVREKLEGAGLPLRPAEYISAHLSLVVVAGVVVQILTDQFVLALLAILVATIAPIVWLDVRAGARTRAFEEQLPEVLNLIAGSLRAGWGMQQSIDLVVQEMLPPASVEFKRVQTEARLGLPIDDAFRSMANRVGSDDFRWAVSAIAIQREVGGNLAEVLDIVANTIRERATLRRHISSLTSEGRLSAVILIALPIVEVVVLLVINPTYMRLLFVTPLGWAMLAASVVLLLVGAVWLRSAMAVEI